MSPATVTPIVGPLTQQTVAATAGNFVFYDVMQCGFGSCTESDIGLFTLTRVVGHYPRSNTLLIDLGWSGCVRALSSSRCSYVLLIPLPRKV